MLYIFFTVTASIDLQAPMVLIERKKKLDPNLEYGKELEQI